jgi:hypothetical protein
MAKVLSRVLKLTWKYRPWPYVFSALALFFLLFAGMLSATASNLKEDAIAKYGGDEVTALMRLVDDSSETFRRRNYAIGMLANLSDARALPVLEPLWTGSDDAGCGTGRNLCQYELKKAIKRSRENKGPNLLARLTH